MIRGVRGAITVENNTKEEVVDSTEILLKEMIQENQLEAEQVSHIWFTVTSDIDAAFPAQATRRFDGWQFVPVMCAREIPVPGSLHKCIRIMLSAELEMKQEEVRHIYLREAERLRPDLELTKKHKNV